MFKSGKNRKSIQNEILFKYEKFRYKFRIKTLKLNCERVRSLGKMKRKYKWRKFKIKVKYLFRRRKRKRKLRQLKKDYERNRRKRFYDVINQEKRIERNRIKSFNSFIVNAFIDLFFEGSKSLKKQLRDQHKNSNVANQIMISSFKETTLRLLLEKALEREDASAHLKTVIEDALKKYNNVILNLNHNHLDSIDISKYPKIRNDKSKIGASNTNYNNRDPYLGMKNVECVSCKFDCENTIVKPFLKGCKKRYYYYGCMKKQSCFTNELVQTNQILTLTAICKHFNGCEFKNIESKKEINLR